MTMTIAELKDLVNGIPKRYDHYRVYTDVGFNEFEDVKDLVRIHDAKIDGYRFPKDSFYIGFVTEKGDIYADCSNN